MCVFFLCMCMCMCVCQFEFLCGALLAICGPYSDFCPNLSKQTIYMMGIQWALSFIEVEALFMVLL